MNADDKQATAHKEKESIETKEAVVQ